jgi:hypothetical protein
MRALMLAVALAAAPALAAPRHEAISDDYPRALADARARNVPLLVDVWAPW